CDVRRRARGGGERHRAQLWWVRLGGALPEFGFLGWTSIINVTADSICAQLALLPPARVEFQCRFLSTFAKIVPAPSRPLCKARPDRSVPIARAPVWRRSYRFSP